MPSKSYKLPYFGEAPTLKVISVIDPSYKDLKDEKVVQYEDALNQIGSSSLFSGSESALT